jgi:hypothetical protein
LKRKLYAELASAWMAKEIALYLPSVDYVSCIIFWLCSHSSG